MNNKRISKILVLSLCSLLSATLSTGGVLTAWSGGLWGKPKYSIPGFGGQYSSVETPSSSNLFLEGLYSNSFGNLAALHVNGTVFPKVQILSSQDSHTNDLQDQMTSPFAYAYAGNNMTYATTPPASTTLGLKLPPAFKLHVDTPLADIAGNSVNLSSLKNSVKGLYTDPGSAASVKLAKTAYDGINNSPDPVLNDDEGKVYWNMNNIKANNFFALNKYYDRAQAIMDTAVGTSQVSSSDIVNLFQHGKAWIGLPNIGANRSPILSDTLYGKLLAGLGVLMPMSDWPTNALLANDGTATDYVTSTTPTLNTPDNLRLATLRRWQAYNENWRGDLPFYRTGPGENLDNGQDVELAAIASGYTSADDATQKAAFARTLGTTRTIKPLLSWTDSNGSSVVSRLPDIVVPDKNLGMLDEDLLHTPEDELDLGPVARQVSWTGQVASVYSQANLLSQIDASIAALGTTDADIKLKGSYSYFRYLVSRADSTTVNNSSAVDTLIGAVGATTTDQSIKAGRVGVMYRRFSSLLPTLDPSTDWNADLFDQCKQLLRQQNLAVYIPGVQVQIKRGGSSVGGKYGNNKIMWIPDWEEARKGSTFGTVANLTSAPTSPSLSLDAARAYLMILDCTRMLDDSFYTVANSTDMSINGVTFKRFNDATYNAPWTVLTSALNDLNQGYSAGGTSIGNKDLRHIAGSSATTDTSVVMYSTQGKWIEHPFKYALDCLRYAYVPCANRFKSLMSALNATAGLTWINKPTSFLQTFMYGGSNLTWAGNGVSVVTTDNFNNTTNFGAASTKGWVVGSKNLGVDTARMPLCVIPTQMRGVPPASYTSMLCGCQVRSLAYLNSAGLGLSDEGSYTLAGNSTDAGKNEMLCYPHDAYNMAEAVMSESNLSDLLNVLIVSV